jgi:hypothetical protein
VRVGGEARGRDEASASAGLAGPTAAGVQFGGDLQLAVHLLEGAARAEGQADAVAASRSFDAARVTQRRAHHARVATAREARRLAQRALHLPTHARRE